MTLWDNSRRGRMRDLVLVYFVLLVVLASIGSFFIARPRAQETSQPSGRAYQAATHWISVWPGQDATALIRHAQQTIDTAGWPVAVLLRSGEHENVSIRGPFVGGGDVYLIGEPGTVVKGIAATRDVLVNASGLRIANPGGANVAATDAWIYLLAGIEHGPSAAEQIVASYDAKVFATADYTVSGGGISHAHAYGDGKVVIGAVTVTATTPVHFEAYVFGAAMGAISTDAVWTGAPVTSGMKAYIHFSSLFYSPRVALPGTGIVRRTIESNVVTLTPEQTVIEP